MPRNPDRRSGVSADRRKEWDADSPAWFDRAFEARDPEFDASAYVNGLKEGIRLAIRHQFESAPSAPVEVPPTPEPLQSLDDIEIPF